MKTCKNPARKHLNLPRMCFREDLEDTSLNLQRFSVSGFNCPKSKPLNWILVDSDFLMVIPSVPLSFEDLNTSEFQRSDRHD